MSELILSHRVNSIESSPTVALNAQANALKRQGKDIINMTVGEPDFETPDFIKEAAIEAIHKGYTKYTAVEGIPELKEAIVHKLLRDNQLSYEPNQVIVSTGAKQSIFNLCQALLNPGDETIVVAPGWVSYTDIVKFCEATPVIINAPQSQNFKLTPEQLDAAITPKTKLVLFNSPNNPTGKMFTKAEWKALGEVLKKHPHVWIAVDDIYEYINWLPEGFSTLLNVCPELTGRTIIINGVSKAYAMTGWRIGYVAGPVELIKAIAKIQSQSTTNACSIAQHAAVAALRSEKSQFQYMIDSFKQRHDQVLAGLSQIEGIECIPADGAFYLFPNVESWVKRLGLQSDAALSAYLLETALVATVPGSAFNMNGHIRLSYAIHPDQLAEALKRLKQL